MKLLYTENEHTEKYYFLRSWKVIWDFCLLGSLEFGDPQMCSSDQSARFLFFRYIAFEFVYIFLLKCLFLVIRIKKSNCRYNIFQCEFLRPWPYWLGPAVSRSGYRSCLQCIRRKTWVNDNTFCLWTESTTYKVASLIFIFLNYECRILAYLCSVAYIQSITFNYGTNCGRHPSITVIIDQIFSCWIISSEGFSSHVLNMVAPYDIRILQNR